MRKGLARRHLIAVLARVPLFGLTVFIAMLDLFFHGKAAVEGSMSRLRQRRGGPRSWTGLTHPVIAPMPLNSAGGRPHDAPLA